MDSVKSICKFYYYDESTAWEEMEKGSVQAIISFPENFLYLLILKCTYHLSDISDYYFH